MDYHQSRALQATRRHYEEAGRWRTKSHEKDYWRDEQFLPKHDLADFWVVLPGPHGLMGEPSYLTNPHYWFGESKSEQMRLCSASGEMSYPGDKPTTNAKLQSMGWCPECKYRPCQCDDDEPPPGWPSE